MSLANEADNSSDGSHARNTSKGGGIGGLIKIILQALIIALAVRTVLIQPFNIPSGSMIPTIYVGEYVLVSKFSYGWSRYSVPFISSFLPSGRLWADDGPKQGDVAVFKLPSDNATDFIKRVIGLPGDKIQMRKGRLFINGAMVPRERIADFPWKDDFGRTKGVPQYIETLPNGVKHPVIEIEGDNGQLDNTAEFVVPPGHYFMMGDDRDNSDDSRADVGYVPIDNFVGRAQIIFFSIGDDPNDTRGSTWKFWEWPTAIRGNRLFNIVR